MSTTARVEVKTKAGASAHPAWPDDYCCDACCAVEADLVEVDGDRLCRDCADKWARGQEPDPEEVAELQRELRHAGIYRGVEIEARLEAMHLDAGLRRFNRTMGRAA